MPVSCLLTPDAAAQRATAGRLEHEMVVTVVGELDRTMEPDLAEVVAGLSTQVCGPVSIVIDLSEVTFVDVFGVRTLRRAVEQPGGGATVRLEGVRRGVVRVFDLLGATELADLAGSHVRS